MVHQMVVVLEALVEQVVQVAVEEVQHPQEQINQELLVLLIEAVVEAVVLQNQLVLRFQVQVVKE
jgi:hypothetical protein